MAKYAVTTHRHWYLIECVDSALILTGFPSGTSCYCLILLWVCYSIVEVPLANLQPTDQHFAATAAIRQSMVALIILTTAQNKPATTSKNKNRASRKHASKGELNSIWTSRQRMCYVTSYPKWKRATALTSKAYREENFDIHNAVHQKTVTFHYEANARVGWYSIIAIVYVRWSAHTRILKPFWDPQKYSAVVIALLLPWCQQCLWIWAKWPPANFDQQGLARKFPAAKVMHF